MTDDCLENITFDELNVGRTASLTRTLSKDDIELFAAMSGDVNPAHMDEAYAKTDIFHGIIGHGMWSGALISTVLGTILPGPGTIYLEQDMRFKNPVHLGDKITVSVTVQSKRKDKPIVTFACLCTNEKGEKVVEGTATVLAPTEKIRRPRPALPDIEIHTHDRYNALIASCRDLQALRTAIVHPVDDDVLKAVMDAVQENLIEPILIGPVARIQQTAKAANMDIGAWELIDVEHSHAAAAKAAELAAKGEVGAIMKGALHTNELLGAIVAPSSGLHTERRISHAYLMDVPTYHKPLVITDAAVNIAPNLDIKADICRNAIDLWRIIYGEDKKPKVALLAAVETVNVKMQATLDAAALCKMADRNQIEGGILDGPLALDNAINKDAADEKGIISDVVGDADILVTPNIEAGNMVAKQLTFLAQADAAGLVLGARVPVILTSRADNLRTRLMSCALAVKVAEARHKGKII